jgi:hypothetical protein
MCTSGQYVCYLFGCVWQHTCVRSDLTCQKPATCTGTLRFSVLAKLKKGIDHNVSPQSVIMQAMDFFVRALTQAAADIERGVDPTKAAAAEGRDGTAAVGLDVSSFLGWAMSTITAATGASGLTPQATQQKPAGTAPTLPGATSGVARGAGAASSAVNGAAQPVRERGLGRCV